jgi:hypothetical protein
VPGSGQELVHRSVGGCPRGAVSGHRTPARPALDLRSVGLSRLVERTLASSSDAMDEPPESSSDESKAPRSSPGHVHTASPWPVW